MAVRLCLKTVLSDPLDLSDSTVAIDSFSVSTLSVTQLLLEKLAHGFCGGTVVFENNVVRSNGSW